jgi:hypothetical protein
VKVILLGATGMVGQGVLRERLLDPEVESVAALVLCFTSFFPTCCELVAKGALDSQYRAIDAAKVRFCIQA